MAETNYKDAIPTLKDEIDTRRATYERERKAHDDAWQLIVKETSDISAAKDLVDTKDPKSVTAFNDRISARNKSAEAHNAHAQVVNTSGSELQGVQQRYIDACNERPFLVGDRDALLKERAAAAAAASAPAKP
jgi:cation transport regulator ChaB